jgi:hypothetical protein
MGESVFASLCDFGSRQRERSPAMICVAGDSFGQNNEYHRDEKIFLFNPPPAKGIDCVRRRLFGWSGSGGGGQSRV